jgi:hypothetical protein
MPKASKPRSKAPAPCPYTRNQVIDDAIEFRRQNPTESFKKIALRFPPLSEDVIRNRFNGRGSRSACGGHNKRLTDAEERGLIDIIDRYTFIGTPLRLDLLASVANRILKKKGDFTPVGKHWAARFVERHPDLKTIKLKFLDQSRKMMHKKELLREWFELFQMLQDEGVEDCNIWNMDETGFRIGVIHISSLVVTRKEVKKVYMANPMDRTLVTSVECVSTDGRTIPPLAILPQKVFMPWFHPNQMPDDYQTAHSDAGYNNSELALLWLEHFDKYTRNGTAKRLLLLDGHGSHMNAEFLDRAKELNILILALPPHSTHLMQPLDVGVFQSLKRAHS